MFWEYDSRLGRRWNLDPIQLESESPYACFGNNPILYSDPNGDFKTKFGAWLYSVVHGGEIGKDKGGEYYVGKRVEVEGTKNPNKAPGELDEVVVAYQRRFDWSGRSVGKDLEFEAMKEAWLTNYEWKQTLEWHHIEYYETDDINEARMSMLKLSTIGLLPNPILKTGTALANASKTTNAIKVSSRIKAGSLQELKALVNQLSKPGSKLTQQELNELKALAQEYGGTIRVDLSGVKGTGTSPHVHVEGLGKSVESRHIWVENGVK